jgi:hypothetical protein
MNIMSLEINGNKLNTGKSVLVESYTDPETHQWYRVYSDGWCEQGGYISTSNSVTDWNLLKPYTDTNYTVVASTSNAKICPVRIISNSKFNADLDYGSRSQRGFWIAKGYIS